MHPTQAGLVIDCGSLASTVAKATASLRASSRECPSPAGVHALHFPAEGTLRRVEATLCQVKGALRRAKVALCTVKVALRRAKVALYNVNVAPRSVEAALYGVSVALRSVGALLDPANIALRGMKARLYCVRMAVAVALTS